MHSIDYEVLNQAAAWLTVGKQCELVTVIKTWGSSPRPEGAVMAMSGEGEVVGSVSGGCIEDDLIERVRAEGITRKKPELVTYGITADEAHRFGLPCGGTIQLLIEPLAAHSRLQELLGQLALRQLVMRSVDLDTGEATLAPAFPEMQLRVTDKTITTIHGPRWRLIIIGAGQLSAFLATIAAGMDYHVTVCDPREEYRSGWQVPGVSVVHAMPDDLVLEMGLDARSAVVALTHDPKLDDLAIMEALRSQAFYVGAIGSRTNNAKRRERLKLFDLTDEQVDKLHGPIGLYIGSKSPSEIAISILAELTAVKNGVRIPSAMRVQEAKDNAPVQANGNGCLI